MIYSPGNGRDHEGNVWCQEPPRTAPSTQSGGAQGATPPALPWEADRLGPRSLPQRRGGLCGLQMTKKSNEHNEGKRDHGLSNMEVTGEVIKGLGLGWMEVRREWKKYP